MGSVNYLRLFLIFSVVALGATNSTSAGEVSFSLDIGNIPLTVRPNPQTEARLAHWNDPMGRLLYHFNQQQSWAMRGTMPGSDRASGVAIRVKAQDGIPIHLVAATVQSGLDTAQQKLVMVRWPWIDDEALAALPLDQQLSIELGRRLVPQ
mgnify:CR=1 FL=1